MNAVGLNGAVFQMFSHGIMTGLFFALVGLVYEKSHTRDILAMGGFAGMMPGIARRLHHRRARLVRPARHERLRGRAAGVPGHLGALA